MLFGFFVIGVLAATATELTEFKPVGRGLLILSRDVVPTLTVVTLKHNIIAWHILISNFRLPICDWPPPLLAFSIGNRQSAMPLLFPISDCRFAIGLHRFLPFQSAIGNWQSAMLLFNHFRDRSRTHRAAPFTNREAQSLLHRDGRDQFNVHRHVVSWHHHFHSLRQRRHSRHVRPP